MKSILVAVILSACVLGSGCAAKRTAHEDRARLRQLAHDYLFKVADERESAAIRQQIRTLGPEAARYLHGELRKLNGYRGTELLLFDALFAEATKQRKSFLDLTADDQAKVFREFAETQQ